MGWEQQVIKTFDLCVGTLTGKRIVKKSNKTGEIIFRGSPLAPLHHTVSATDIIIRLDADGNFLSWRKADEDDRKVVAPVSPKSRTRSANAFICPTAIVESMKYILLDAGTEQDGERTPNPYAKLHIEWSEHPCVQNARMEMKEPLLALAKYLRRGTVFADFTDAEKKSLGGKKCRFEVVGCREYHGDPDLSKNPYIWKLWQMYMDDMLEPTTEKGLSYISGEVVPLMVWSQAPSGVFFGSRAKLIVSSDGFEGTGYLTNRKLGIGGGAESCQVGEIEAQKINNMLRWLMENQSWSISQDGDQKMLCWRVNDPLVNINIEQNRADAAIGIEDEGGNISFEQDAEALQFRDLFAKAACGMELSEEESDTLDSDEICIMSMCKTCDGRIAVTGYECVSSKHYVQLLQKWVETTMYRAGDKYKPLHVQSIIAACYSRRARSKTSTDIQNNAARVWDSINYGARFPYTLAQKAFRRGIDTLGYVADIRKSQNEGYWAWLRHIQVVCAIIRKYQTDTGYDPKTDPDYLRDTLYGELLAWLERVEIVSILVRNIQKRQANAWRDMKLYFDAPASTASKLLRAAAPYVRPARVQRIPSILNATQHIDDLVDQLESMGEHIRAVEWGTKKPLGPNALLSYNTQRLSFMTHNTEDNAEFQAAETESADDNMEKEGGKQYA